MLTKKNFIGSIFITAFLVLAIGCGGGSGGGSGGSFSSSSTNSPGTFSGGHPVVHQTAFLSDPDSCRVCPGADLRGGNAGVSCFSSSYAGASCHANGPASHPVGWADPGQHGAAAKATPDSSHGFSYCRNCHGQDFSGGIVNVSCFTCHGVNAPHSPYPWRGGARTHVTTNVNNAAVCAACHTNGANSNLKPSPFDSGAAPGCFNNTLCHSQVNHAANFSDGAVHGPQAKADLTTCQQCHASPSGSGAGSNPRFNVNKGTLVNGCENCHDPYTAHPVYWAGHTTSGNRANACGLCHGAGLAGGVGPSCLITCHMESADSVHPAAWSGSAIYLEHGSYVGANGTSKCSNQYCHGTSLTGVSGSGPACSTCHTWPYSGGSSTCTFCHGYPPSGTQSPDVAGKHAKHMALANVDCSSCHNGAGYGTANHYNGTAEVSFATAFNSKSGTASFNATAKTCSNISCHGGPRTQTSNQANSSPPTSTASQTPSWLSGSISVNTQCTSCHVYGTSSPSPEYNSYYSGRHKRHVFGQGFSCTECHDTTKLSASHFTNLNTPAVSGASATIISAANYSGGNCTISCHGKNHNSANW